MGAVKGRGQETKKNDDAKKKKVHVLTLDAVGQFQHLELNWRVFPQFFRKRLHADFILQRALTKVPWTPDKFNWSEKRVISWSWNGNLDERKPWGGVPLLSPGHTQMSQNVAQSTNPHPRGLPSGLKPLKSNRKGAAGSRRSRVILKRESVLSHRIDVLNPFCRGTARPVG